MPMLMSPSENDYRRMIHTMVKPSIHVARKYRPHVLAAIGILAFGCGLVFGWEAAKEIGKLAFAPIADMVIEKWMTAA